MNSSVLGGNSILSMEANTSQLHGLTPSPTSSISSLHLGDMNGAHVGAAAASQTSEGLVVPSEEYSTIQLIQAMFADDCVFHPTAENYVMIVAFCIIFCLSVIGNSVVVVVILQQRSMRSVTNLYLLNLALSDLLLSVVCMPPTLVSSLVYCWVFGDLLCKLLAYLQPVVVTASAYTLAAIAAERYYAICKPLHSRVWHTRSHAMAVIAFVWLISIITNFFMLFMYELRTYNRNGLNCSPKYNPPVHFIYQIYMTFMLLIIPLVIMSVLYAQVIKSLRSGIRMDIAAIEVDNNNEPSKTSDESRSNGTAHNNSSVKQNNVSNGTSNGNCASSNTASGKKGRWMSLSGEPRGLTEDFATRKNMTLIEQSLRSTHSGRTALVKQRLIRMLIVIVIIFFCCWTPSYIWWLLLNAQDSFGTFNVWNSELNTFITVLTYLSSCTNPITYCFLNSKFRNALFLSFGCRSFNGKFANSTKKSRTHLQRIYAPINNNSTLASRDECSQVSSNVSHSKVGANSRFLTLGILNRLKNAMNLGSGVNSQRRYTESQLLEEPLAVKLKLNASSSSSYALSSKESNI